MMAEPNEENLSMEDILSSIKDILTEDVQIQSPQTTATAPQNEEKSVSANLPESPVAEEAEDILDLSPSMKIEEEPGDIDLDDVLGNIDTNLDNLGETSDESDPFLKPAATEENDLPEQTSPFKIEEFNADDILNSLPRFDEDKDLDSDPFDTISASINIPETVEDVPAEAADKVEDEIPEVEAVPFEEFDPAPEVEPQPVDEPETSVLPDQSITEDLSDNLDLAENEYAKFAEVEESKAEISEYIAPTETMVEDSTQTILTEAAALINTPEAEPEVEPVVTGPAPSSEDVSATIIDNFAKMFAVNTPATEAETKPAATLPHPELIGNGATTIEEVVANVIRSIIGEEVAANWKQGIDYDSLAREEIKNQTRQWLDQNLPTMVEKIVKQEIARVMAKVGSQD